MRRAWIAAATLSPVDRCLVLLPAAAALDHPSWVEDRGAMLETGVRVLRLLTAAVTARPLSALPVHEQLAAAWRVPADRVPVLRAVLVLSADHEFNASAFAARVVASTGANLYGATMAGLAALNGPRHGGATRRVAAMFDDLKGTTDLDADLGRMLRDRVYIPGFGHPLYPDGDIRAATLMAMLRETMPNSPELAFAERLAAAVERLIDRKPNVDFANVAVERVLGLPKDSALALFLLGRTVGWIAHSLEQAAHGALIRPRARYTGPRDPEPEATPRMTDALIIIDMQQGAFGEGPPKHDAAGLIGRLNKLADAVRARGGAVVFIQHDGPPGDPFHPDLPGWQLVEDLGPRPPTPSSARNPAMPSWKPLSRTSCARARSTG